MEEAIEEGVRCGEFLNALFFGADPYEKEESMPRKIDTQAVGDPSQTVTVPVNILSGFIGAFSQAMHYLNAASSLIEKFDRILLQQREQDGQFVDKSSGDADPGAKDL